MQEKPVYRVYIDDNFHYMDEEYRDLHGSYEDLDGAIAVCKAIVDQFLRANYTEGMTAEELWTQYHWFGEDPFILGPNIDSPPFSAWNYAKEMCAEICGPMATS